MNGPVLPETRLRRKVKFYPFVLVFLIVFCILFFVGYPVERYFLGNRILPPVESVPFPPPGIVGYLKPDAGYAIFASPDLNTLLFWEKEINDPIRQRLAKAFVDDGKILMLPQKTLAMSVSPKSGEVQILSGAEFGKRMYIRVKHVRLIPLKKNK